MSSWDLNFMNNDFNKIEKPEMKQNSDESQTVWAQLPLTVVKYRKTCPLLELIKYPECSRLHPMTIHTKIS